MKGGDHVVLVCRLPSAFTLGQNDTTLTYIMVKVSFTGNDSIIMVPTCVRVVCANTVAFAVSQASGKKSKAGEPLIFRLRHTASLQDRLSEAREHLAGMDSLLSVKASEAERLASKAIAKDEAESFIRDMFPLVTAEGETLTTRQTTERTRKVRVLRLAWSAEARTMESALKGSAWHLLQAVTRAVDFGGLERRKGSERARDENTFSSITQGSGAKLKMLAESRLLSLAGA